VELLTHLLLLPANGPLSSSSSSSSSSHWSNSSGSEQMQLGAGYRVQVEQDQHFVYLVGLRPGKHRVRVQHSAAATAASPDSAITGTGTGMPPDAAPATPPSKWDPNNTDFAYAATLHGIDTATSGSWVGKYGSRGYVLFNYSSETSEDVVMADPRIKQVCESVCATVANLWSPTLSH
jgi:hypothetical protein